MKRLLFILSLALVCLQSCSDKEDINTCIAKINNIRELQVLQYEMKCIVKNDKDSHNLVEKAKDKFGDRFILYSCKATLTASVNLSEFSRENVEVDSENGNLTITLPHITKDNLSLKLDDKNINKVYEKVGKLRSDFTNEEIDVLRKKAEDEISEKVDKTGIIPEAEDNVREAMKILFEPVGYNVTVKFKENEEK